MSKRVAILGSGITAIAVASVIADEFREVDIDIYGEQWGGEFLRGGLKYIHNTKYSRRLMDRIGMNYNIKPVNAAVLMNGELDIEAVPYPLCFLFMSSGEIEGVMNSYALKTGRKEGDRSVMGNPFDKQILYSATRLDVDNFATAIMNLSKDKRWNFLPTHLRFDSVSALNDTFVYDLVINTIPLSAFSSIMKKCIFEYNTLTEISFPVSDENHLWFDYAYIPGAWTSVHRVSIKVASTSDSMMSMEIDGDAVYGDECKKVLRALVRSDILKSDNHMTVYRPRKIKGHITRMEIDYGEMSSALETGRFINIGRYATGKPRMLLSDVAEELLLESSDTRSKIMNVLR